MKKKKIDVVILIPGFAAVMLAFISYFCCENPFISLAVLLIYALIGYVLLLPMITAYQSKSRRRNEAYRFINAYLISLSATQSLERAFGAGCEGIEGEFAERVNDIGNLEAKQRTEYLASYFENPLYQMFLSILSLYEDQGGDVLALSGSLLEELTRVEQNARGMEKEGRKNLLQYLVLWGMAIAVVAFLRIGLGTFYALAKNEWVYILAIAAFFLFLLGSVCFYVIAYTGEKPQMNRLFAFMRKEQNDERD